MITFWILIVLNNAPSGVSGHAEPGLYWSKADCLNAGKEIKPPSPTAGYACVTGSVNL